MACSRRGAFTVQVGHERKSRVTLAARLTGKSAAETISAMLAVFGRIDPHLRRSITFDNDTAFAQHALLRTMRDMTTWFCDAYASWQKGGIENANGRLRRWLPRHLDIDRTSDQDIQEIVLTTNLTPRKCLGFKTPFQALIAELGKDVQIRFSLSTLRFAPESRERSDAPRASALHQSSFRNSGCGSITAARCLS